ncbi:MAG: DNA mismatch repair protein MutS [Ignavibacteria bacterium GWA2_35_9]|nr:MAG: DNA mismatch repair protein MutS [Ignavibacteria bacterium GWA2_35_9]OGU47022.1 MAG: DNA mismatch repair protein MutS [Ignavibacteria bacterium GWB2_36_8]OGU51471.1 MAG: DNA mismatch repair protein MutS [Ignavibacteria bacterium GWC2_36_12]
MISQSVLEKLEFPKILQYISVYSVTEKGKKIVQALTPSFSSPEFITEGNLVSEAKEILIKDIHPPLIYLTDLETSLSKSKIEGAVLESKKILEILSLIISSRNFVHYLKSNSEVAPGLLKLTDDLFVDKVLEHHIQKVINENGEIKENASPKLAEIRRDIREKHEELIRLVNRITKALKEKELVREDYITLRDGRVVVPVKAEHKRHIRGFIHSESATGQTVYIEPEETLEMNNDIVSLSFEERREIERILRELTAKIGSVAEELKSTHDTIGYLDSVFAKAKYSIEIIGSFPQVDKSKPIVIQDARHPILIKKLGRDKTVPLNLENKGWNVIVITGPNAGGKTVVLKTIGLLSLMLQSGIHIPASPDSNFHKFNNILVDIGDEQSIEDDLSTFSSHLSNIKKILLSADSDSLVLLDEVGTGTDPSEGSALAVAVLLMLQKRNALVFASTHHGSLKLIAHDQDGFENAAMEFDSQNLKPTYMFKQGIPGSSYAFEIARRIGLENSFLDLAKEHLDKDKHKLEKFLVDIEAKSHLVEEKLKNVEIENLRLSGLSNLYKQNLEKLEKDKKQILAKAKEEAEEYIRNINKKFEKIVKELKESKAEKEIIKSSQEIIKEIKERNKSILPETTEDINTDFNVGDFVSVKGTNTTGKILEMFHDSKKATLLVGTVKMQVPLQNLIHSAKKIEEKKEREYSFINFQVEMRLDIRGERPEEAEFEVNKFVDNAYAAGLERIEILHGKGTGALKKTVKEILLHHNRVKTFYFAPIEIGGDGITIAELK